MNLKINNFIVVPDKYYNIIFKKMRTRQTYEVTSTGVDVIPTTEEGLIEEVLGPIENT